MANILSRLPCKDILNYHTVSKNWYSSFKTNQFIQMHVQNPRNRTNKLLISGTMYTGHGFHQTLHILEPATTTKLQIKTPYSELDAESEKFLGSADGILCLHKTLKDGSGIFYLFNPITKRTMELPNLEYLIDMEHVLYAIWHQNLNNEYFVLCLFTERNQQHDQVKKTLYSSRTEIWGKSTGISVDCSILRDTYISFNNFLIFSTQEIIEHYSVLKSVIIYNTSADSFSEIHAHMNTKSLMFKLITYHNQVGIMLFNNRRRHKYSIDIWLFDPMILQPESWTQVLHIDGIPRLYRPLSILNDSIMLCEDDAEVELSTNSGVYSLDPNTKRLQMLQKLTSDTIYWFSNVCTFVDTFSGFD